MGKNKNKRDNRKDDGTSNNDVEQKMRKTPHWLADDQSAIF